MNNPIPITDASRSHPSGSGWQARAKHAAFRTSDYRRMLSEMRLRPPSRRVFLKKLLKRALVNGTAQEFPVVNHAVLSLVDHT